MPRSQIRKPVSSLFSLSVECILSNLLTYTTSLKYLPPYIKERILHKFLVKCTWNPAISNEILSVLVHTNLKRINLSSINIDDNALETVKMCHGLTDIRLRNCNNQIQNISSKGLSALFEQTRNLIALDISHCKEFNDDVLHCLAANCPKLRELNAEGCNVTDEGLNFLVHRNKKIRCLTISQTKISGDGISAAVKNKNCSYLQELRLDNCLKVDDEVLKTVIYNCPKIEILTFYNCAITDETSIFQDIMVACKNLKQLHWTITW